MNFLNLQAIELNKKLSKNNKTIFSLLSKKGKKSFFPKKGIISQSADAKGKKINATIGVALNDSLVPLSLSGITSKINLSSTHYLNYSPSGGNIELRTFRKKIILSQNPTISNEISLPIVCCGVTHAISTFSFLFVDEGDEIILPDLFWENYSLIFENSFGAKLKTFSMFLNNSFNLEGFKKSISKKNRKKIVVLNFPNNLTGYSLTKKESEKVLEIILNRAKKGDKIICLVDDAYFVLFYEDETSKESLFSKLSSLHENILAVKVDGATKEDFVWSLRVGFITFGSKNVSSEVYSILEEKTSGIIRATVSNSSNLSQTILLESYSSKDYFVEKKKNFELLKKRYLKVKSILLNKKFSDCFTSLPFNSGYFLCIKLNKNIDPEKVRKVLLEKYSIGVISFDNLLRIAFSSVKEEDLNYLFESIYKACKES